MGIASVVKSRRGTPAALNKGCHLRLEKELSRDERKSRRLASHTLSLGSMGKWLPGSISTVDNSHLVAPDTRFQTY